MQNKTKPQSTQDAFNRIWQFFIVEDHKQSKKDNFCAYRGNTKGEACAVGCMMPTEMARKADNRLLDGDDSGISVVLERFPSIYEWFSQVDKSFLKAAQTAHDDCNFDTDKDSLLMNLAQDFGLTVPAATLGDLTKGRNRVLANTK